MAKIDIEKFICSLIERSGGINQQIFHSDLISAIKEQGLEYKNGEIIKTQRRVAAEAKEAIFNDECEMIRKRLLADFSILGKEEWGGLKVKDICAWLEKQGNPNKEYHRVPSTTLKRLYMNEAKYELLKSDIMEGIVGDFEKGKTHSYLTIKIPMLLCPSNCAKGDKVKLIIVREE